MYKFKIVAKTKGSKFIFDKIFNSLHIVISNLFNLFYLQSITLTKLKIDFAHSRILLCREVLKLL
ncbi:hypothetical protein SDC9_122593 [bioreactor metagenome]|uniref:Uncharacterized protein n=1 Tax=bioreactor metagenome TaxID=1076179 RepID=A0A645CF49_9ZZZZ